MYKKVIKFHIVMLLIMSHVLLMTGCNNSNPTETKNQEPPTMPPASSMQLDLSAFGGTGTLAKSNAGIHFTTAAITVAVINTWVVLGLAPAVFLFGQALNETPVLESDAKFHWKFTSTFALIRYNTDLAGWIDVANKQSNWEMHVSAPNVFNKFKYYDGTCALDLKSGRWTFYKPQNPDSGKAMIQIDWQMVNDSTRTLTFTNVLEGNASQGTTLTYNVDGRDVSMTFFNSVSNKTAQVYWDAITTAGCIDSPDYNGGVPGCWDEHRNDVP
ncbi:hypothetical protein JW960_29605 [candidate division KSB1 bacterium]|nr:hypothetical protein [candidate division KSB1 bacterium]